MNPTPEIKARIEQHINAVRANLGDKEESVQNEILEGLRDHINEALARHGGPVTPEVVQAVLDDMDDPASYAEEPLRAGGAGAVCGRAHGGKWLYVALAFLAVNMVGVWKLIQIERKTGTAGGGGGDYSSVAVPHVPSGDKAGVRYPDGGAKPPPVEGGGGKVAAEEPSTLRSIAFMNNANPELQRPDQELSWLFSANVVEASAVGKPLAVAPMKFTPEVAGAFEWKTPEHLIFKPANPWQLGQVFTAELAGELTSRQGGRYEGTRNWRFGTANFEMKRLVQHQAPGYFLFKANFSLPVSPDSLAAKLKLHYLTADGEKLPLPHRAYPDTDEHTVCLETAIVPAVSFLCEIEPGLQPKHWADGTRERIERRLVNDRVMSVQGAVVDSFVGGGRVQVSLTFSDPPLTTSIAQFIEVTTLGPDGESVPVPVNIRPVPGLPFKVALSGDFLAGTTYEVKIRRGLQSRDGKVLPYTSTRTLVVPGEGPQPAVNLKPTFAVVLFQPAQAVITSGKQELSWKFPQPMVTPEMVGPSLKEAPVRLTPEIPGGFFWRTALELVFRPNTEWALDQYYEARLTGDLVSLSGARYEGLRFWSFGTPAMAIKEIRTIDARAGFKFGVEFTMPPAADSLANKLKIFTLDAAGAKSYLPHHLDTHYSGSPSLVISVPSSPNPRIRFELEAGFRPANWEQGIRAGAVVAAAIDTVLNVESIAPSQPGERLACIRIKFSESVDVKTAEPFISMEPPVKFTIEREQQYYRHPHTLRLTGEFSPQQEYQVRVKAGLPSERGCLLIKESSAAVTITRTAAALAFAGTGGYLSPTGSMLVPVKSRNLPKCKVSVAPVMASNLVFFAKRRANGESFSIAVPAGDEQATESDYYYDDYGHGRPAEDLTGNAIYEEMKLPSEPNRESTTYVKLGDFTKAKGAYLVQVSGVDENNPQNYQRRLRDSRLVVVTDLGISAKSTASHLFVWVCSIKDAKPVGGVEVAAYSGNNQYIAKALTNADGVAAIPCDTKNKNTTPFLVTAQHGEDLSYLALDGDILRDASYSNPPTRDYLTSGCEAFVFTDRGIFRPGETVHARAILRQADFSAPQPFPVVFQIIKPDGRLLKEITAMPNAFGAVEMESVMPEFLPTGRYTLRVRIPKAKNDLGATSFLLEDFVPPQIRVAVKADPERVAAKDKLTAQIHAEHLFGAPAAGLTAKLKCLYSIVPFTPKQWPGYQFGRDTGRVYGQPGTPGFRMNDQDIEGLALDADGKATAEIGTTVPANAPGLVRAQMQSTVFEASGRSVTATSAALIDPYPFYIGMKKLDGGWVKSGQAQKLAVVAVRPDGEPFQPTKPLLVRMFSVDWHYSYKSAPGGGYRYESHREMKLMREEELDLSSGNGEYTFTASGWGERELVIADPVTGSSSAIAFYASDYEQSWTTTDREQPDSLTLKLDKPAYRHGETAKLTIQSPFAGTALLTIESDKVLLSRVILLEKNTAEVDVEVKEGYAPNVHCTVSVIRPAGPEAVWKGHRAFGSVPLKVDPARHRMQVALEAPPTIQPQSKLRTKILVKDDAGQPVDGEVTLVAVDEAICMLTSFKSPSPLDWLYQLRRLAVDSHDIYAELMEVLDESVLTKQSHTSGGDDGGLPGGVAERLTKRLNPIKANRFKPVALWASNVAVTGGVAEIEMDIPEFTGELRLMAVACNAKLLGGAQGMVKVKRPLIVQPSLPRFLAPGDECQMDVTVFNEMGKDITAKLRITCGGPLSTTVNERDIAIAKGASASVSIPMVAGKVPGKALVTVICEAETVKYSDTIEIAVRPPVSAEVVADSGSLAPGKSIVISPQVNWLPESVFRTLKVAKDPGLELAHGLQYLLRYPYGCVEQTTSAAFPLLYLPDLANHTIDKSMTRESVRGYVDTGVWRVLSMQQAGGGFSYWPGYQELCPWGTSYATHFLLEARKAGYEVPQGGLERALKALRAAVERVPAADQRGELFYDNLAYACYVLAVSGEPVNSWQERMLEMKSGLSYYARLMNASSLLVQGDPKRAVPLLEELGLPAGGPRDMGGCFNSPNRNAALLLSAWLDINPEHPSVIKLVATLGKARLNGYWGTTQESAMALMALGKYARRMKSVTREFKGTITLPGGATEAFDHSKERTWEIARGETGALTLINDGPGMLYYSFSAEGVPIDTAEYYKKLESRNRGLKVTREWLDEHGKPLDPTTVRQNDLVVARITLEPNGHTYDNIAIEDLLPAGLEVENPSLDTAQVLPWLTTKFDWCARRDIRDDRVLLFTKPVSGTSTFCYLARAVTPGRFTVPPVSAEGMYDPDVRSITSQTEMIITK